MKYSNDDYSTARAIIADRKARAEQKATAIENEIYSKSKEYRLVTDQINAIGQKIVKAVISGADVSDKIEEIKKETQKLYSERSKILENYGLTDDDITPDYYCKKCNDTGELDNSYCDCFRDVLKNNAYNDLNSETSLELSKFSDFSLKYYPTNIKIDDTLTAKEHMSKIFEFCKEYADGFDLHSQNLIMMGGTGLGKTHLSLAIAGKVLEKGYSVIYGSAQNLLSKIEREHFSSGASNNTEENLLSCDLLVLDDFGTEFISPFTQSAVYNIINTRLLKKLPTIISTNLSTSEIKSLYNERIASRIIGHYEPLKFFGEDVRQQKFSENR